MRAAIFNPYLDTLGGGERYILSFAKVLIEAGYTVDIQWKSPQILKLLHTRFGVKTDKKINVVSDIRKGEGYDVCFWVSDGSIPLLRASRNFLHFQVPFKNVNGKTLLNKMKFFRIEKVICNSEFTKNVVDKEYGVKSIVIYPPVDTKAFKSKKKEKTILYVGRFSGLVQNKGQLYLVKLFKKLSRQLDDKEWRLVLAGGVEVGVGDYLKRIEKRSRGLNVEIIKSPIFKDLIDLYGKSSFFWSASGYGVDETLHPEKVEHFGITLVEAMSAGCVPFAYANGGALEIITDNKNGYLWKEEDKIINKTIELINSKKEYRKNSASAKKRAVDFGLDNFAKEVKKLLKVT